MREEQGLVAAASPVKFQRCALVLQGPTMVWPLSGGTNGGTKANLNEIWGRKQPSGAGWHVLCAKATSNTP